MYLMFFLNKLLIYSFVSSSIHILVFSSRAPLVSSFWLVLIGLFTGPSSLTSSPSFAALHGTRYLQASMHICTISIPNKLFYEMTKANAIFPWSAILGWPWSAQHTRVVGVSAGEQDDGIGVAQCRGCHIGHAGRCWRIEHYEVIYRP